jgi:hypothetical protein
MILGQARHERHYGLNLRQIDEIVEKPIYFALGNHEFYHGAIRQIRRMVAGLADESKYLKYLTAMAVVELTPRTAIIGHDGCCDRPAGGPC